MPVARKDRLDAFGESTGVGWIGVSWRRLPALLGVIDLESPAAVAGLQSGDQVVELGGLAVEDWVTLERAYRVATDSQSAPGNVSVTVLRGRFEDVDKDRVVLDVPTLGELEKLGVVSATILVSVVEPGLPAAKAGLAAGDLVLSVDGETVGSFSSFADTIQTSGGRALEIGYARDGVLRSSVVQPIEREVAHPMDITGMTQKLYQIGVRNVLATLPGAAAREQVRNPLVAVPLAVQMTINTSRLYLEGLGKLMSSGFATEQLAGPIGIAEIARKSLDRGWMTYLSTMIFISINLGFLNLLPIPILDGGQILIFSIEGIKRSPISARTREITQQIGLVFLMMLMGLAFFNDLSRHWDQFIKWLTA